MLSNSLSKQLNMNRRICHIAIKVVSAEFFCSVVWWVVRAACVEVSTGAVEASKARPGFTKEQIPAARTLQLSSISATKRGPRQESKNRQQPGKQKRHEQSTLVDLVLYCRE
jgi:hypothetical protein